MEINLSRPGLTGGMGCYVHRMVCQAFHPKPEMARIEVAHWDGNKQNNHRDNLRWATHIENNHDKYLHGTVSGILTESHVRQIRKHFLLEIRRLAKLYGVRRDTIADVLYGKSWKPLK